MGASDVESRLVELEIRYSEQADLLTQLNEALIGQQRTMDVLLAEVQRLKQKLAAAEPGLVDAQEREKPPHY
jgi:SlyX protein